MSFCISATRSCLPYGSLREMGTSVAFCPIGKSTAPQGHGVSSSVEKIFHCLEDSTIAYLNENVKVTSHHTCINIFQYAAF